MPPLVRRGRWIYLVLMTLVVIDRGSSAIYSLIVRGENFDFMMRVVMPLAIVYFFITVWYGIYRHRWWLALLCVWFSGKNLFSLSYALIHMASITVPDQSDFLLNIVRQTFFWPLLYSCFYMIVGLLVLFLPSLKAFIKYQSESKNHGWLGRLSNTDDEDSRTKIIDTINALHEEKHGGPPSIVKEHLGNLPVPSGTLVLGDPQYLPSIEVPSIDAKLAAISGKYLIYPSGLKQLGGLVITLSENKPSGLPKKTAGLTIDSAKVVVIDQDNFNQHWTDDEQERIGVISTEEDNSLLSELQQRFHLETVQVNSTQAEVVSPISVSLEEEIYEYIQSEPQFAESYFSFFSIQSENSFDRVLNSKQVSEFLPISKVDSPKMFVSNTGHGDGFYNVFCRYKDDQPIEITINFIDFEKII